MAYTGITLGTYLRSKFPNSKGLKKDNIMGEFYHYNDIIDATFNEPFKDMRLYCPITDQFKKDFCKEFYYREICTDVFMPFQLLLENTLNVDCFILLKYMDKIRQLTDIDLLKNIDIYNEGETITNSNDSSESSNNGSLGLGNTTPNTLKEISYSQNNLTDEEKSIIKYADSLQEQYNKSIGKSSSKNDYTGKTNNHTHGYQGRTLLDVYKQLLDFNIELEREIFNLCDRNFSMIYN